MSIRNIFLFMLTTCVVFAQEKQVTVDFKDLPRLLKQSGPQQQIVDDRRAAVVTQQKAAKQWSNPQLNYNREKIESAGLSETEQIVSLSKSFNMPWNYLQQRRIANIEMNAANFEHEAQSNQLIARLRGEYVQLRLLKDLTEKQKDLLSMMDSLNRTVEARLEEGAISAVEARLLSISLFSLQKDLIQTGNEFRQTADNLKLLLGIDPVSEIIPGTSIEFRQINIKGGNEGKSTVNHPGLKARLMQSDAAGRRVTLEKSKILPSFTFSGGYKKVNPDWEGYTLGLSLPIPLLNWNGPQIEAQKIERRLRDTKVALFRQQLQIRKEQLIRLIRSEQNLLQENQTQMQEPDIAQKLLTVYREGTLSLTELLNAIQIYRDGNRQYTERLIIYFKAAFELETLIGKQIITF